VKTALLFLSLPIAAALAFAPVHSAPQDPQNPSDPNKPDEVATILSLSELQYKDMQGKMTNVSARSVVEIRMFDGMNDHIRLELLYDNGDYSLIDAQAMHLLRQGGTTRDVRLVRSASSAMRFPQLPK
jgi:hypothetical protein